MKKILLILVLTFASISGFSQQDAQYTNYMYNTITINPAYAGSRDVMSVFGLHRNQWVGLDGAPVTNNFSINTPFSNSKFGLGLSVVNDKIGPISENAISADISYSIPTSEKFKISFGLKATADLLNVDFDKLNIYNPGDALSQQNIDNKFSPNMGAGIYFHSNWTYLGISVPHFFETRHFDKSNSELASTSVMTDRMHYYFIAGHVFEFSPTFKFKPAVLSKMAFGAPVQLDLSANFMIHEKLTLGLAYRWDSAVSALAGFQMSDKWFIGYAYDSDVTKMTNNNSGSHEIFLRFELFKSYDKFVSPRFF